MKKVLWSIAAATLILTLAGCSNAAPPAQLENHLLRPVVETVPEDTGAVEDEDEAVALSAGNDQLVDNATVKEDSESSAKPESQAEPPTAPQPQEPEPQAAVKASVTFVLDSQKETTEPSAPNTPAQPPEPEPVPLPLRNQSQPRSLRRLPPVNPLNQRSASTTGSAMRRSTPRP